MASCCHSGPGYASPLEAKTKGPTEKILFIPCIVPGKYDYLATVDCDPSSPTFCQVISRAKIPDSDGELHHTGWNACSSCHDDPSAQRRYLIAPALRSGNIYIFDTINQREPVLIKTIKGEEIKAKCDLSWPHTSHCLGSGEIMISHMGDSKGNAKANFLLLDGTDFSIKGTWTNENANFGYDFWYQPRHNIMASTEWGEPNALKDGFNPQHVADGKYGNDLHLWDWKEKKKLKTINLGSDGFVPLEVRFLHDPEKAIGYVGVALSSTIKAFYKDDSGEWQAKTVISVPSLEVDGWALPSMPGLITDILISLDDRFLFFSNWLHGDIRCYDISDPLHPKLAGSLFVGGSIRADGAVTLKDGKERPVIPTLKGASLRGGPQMLQLSLDGKRLYCTNSLFSPWDRQFYPSMVSEGSQLYQIDVGADGSLSLNQGLYVDFGKEPEGPALAHEVRYPGGDCSSDIWL
jgi:selenium-binding protein 1